MSSPLRYDPDDCQLWVDAGFDNQWYQTVMHCAETYHAHVVPVGDTGSHILAEDCPCDPFLNEEGVWEHRSYDRREDYDTGKRKRS